MSKSDRFSFSRAVLTAALLLLAAAFLFPIIIVLINSFKSRFSINDAPFSLPNAQNFAGLENYINGIADTSFFSAFGYSLFITVFSVDVISQNVSFSQALRAMRASSYAVV